MLLVWGSFYDKYNWFILFIFFHSTRYSSVSKFEVSIDSLDCANSSISSCHEMVLAEVVYLSIEVLQALL